MEWGRRGMYDLGCPRTRALNFLPSLTRRPPFSFFQFRFDLMFCEAPEDNDIDIDFDRLSRQSDAGTLMSFGKVRFQRHSAMNRVSLLQEGLWPGCMMRPRTKTRNRMRI